MRLFLEWRFVSPSLPHSQLSYSIVNFARVYYAEGKRRRDGAESRAAPSRDLDDRYIYIYIYTYTQGSA